MRLVEAPLSRPVTVLVVVLLAAIFGTIALLNTPVQLKPTVDRPEISVEVEYPGAAAQEVERQITDRVEEFLASAEGLREMRSSSQEGRSEVTLEYEWGVDKDLAALDVFKKIARIQDLPEDIRDPVVSATASDEERPVLWTNMAYTDGREHEDLVELTRIAEDIVKPRFERIDGVGRVWVRGAFRRELRVVLDPVKLATLRLTVQDVENALRRENRNIPAGNIEQGSKRDTVRTIGEFGDIASVENVYLGRRAGRHIRLQDVATVVPSFEQPDSITRINGLRGISVPVYKETGANVLEIVGQVEKVMEDLNRDLAPHGITVRKTFDEATYIYAALENVTWNMLLGSFLAAAILIFFLRSASAVLTVSVAIPIAIISSFILFNAFGRSINVISLAGITFAAGMVVDNAIIVLENIARQRASGKSTWQAVVDGTAEVWGAVLASTLTTMAVFLPILFVQDEAGQLFKDIAFAITSTVGLSLLIALTVIPTLASRLMRGPARDHHRPGSLVDRIFLGDLGRLVSRVILLTHRFTVRNLPIKLATILVLTGAAIASWNLLPSAEYLPPGNRPMVFGSLRFPPGTSLERTEEIMETIEERLMPMKERDYFFIVVRPRGGFIGMSLQWEYADVVDRVVEEMQERLGVIPQANVFLAKSNIFTRGVSGGKDLKIYVTNPSLEALTKSGAKLEEELLKIEGIRGVQSSFELGNPERQVVIDRAACSALGLTASDVGQVVEALVRGRRVGRYRGAEFNEEVDIRLIGPESFRDGSAQLDNVPLIAPGETPVNLGSLVRVDSGRGPTRIDHIERERSITLDLRLAPDAVLEEVIRNVEEKVLQPMRPELPAGASLTMAGSADDLTRTKNALSDNFLLAILITYLLMAALFESFFHPFIVMFSVPLATAGAVLGIRAIDAEFNVMTMLGFIILCGIVVNNAILLVDRTLRDVRSGIPVREAIEDAVRTRMRPIFMSTITTCLGMLPLILSDGAGTELYKGLAAAVFGGLLCSSIFTLILIPCLLSLLMRSRKVEPAAPEGAPERREDARTEAQPAVTS